MVSNCFGNKKKIIIVNPDEPNLFQLDHLVLQWSDHAAGRFDAAAALTLPDPAELGEGKNSAPNVGKNLKFWANFFLLGILILGIKNPESSPSGSGIYSRTCGKFRGGRQREKQRLCRRRLKKSFPGFTPSV